jgi:hypothetical protein
MFGEEECDAEKKEFEFVCIVHDAALCHDAYFQNIIFYFGAILVTLLLHAFLKVVS